MASDVQNAINLHLEKSLAGLFMHASECITPPSVRLAHSTHLAYRYSHTKRNNLDIGDVVFSIGPYFNDLRDSLYNELTQLLKCYWVGLNPLSGMNAVNSIIQALVKKDDMVFAVAPEDGGHPSVKGIVLSCGGTVERIPFQSNMQIDWVAMYEKIRKCNPRLIMLNISDSLLIDHMPDNPKKLNDTILCVDISHYLSLYLTEKIDNLFERGANILVTSTHKSFPGPHKGLIAANDKNLSEFLSKELSLFISSDHSHHLLAFWVALKEFKEYGNNFVAQVIRNHTALGDALVNEGFSVITTDHDYGQTHQLWVAFESKEVAIKSFLLLEEIGIYVNCKKLSFNNGWGIRIGVQEVTILGLKESEMYSIAKIIGNRLFDRKSNVECIDDVFIIIKKINPLWKHNSKWQNWLQNLNRELYD